MYMQHELREVAEHRQTEALERIHTLHSLMRVAPGFIRTLACRYPGRTDQYAWLRFWDSSEQQSSFRQTPPAREFAQTRPEGLYGPLPGGIGAALNWQSIAAERIDGGPFLVRSVFEVGAGRDDEFLELRRAYQELALASKGIDTLMTFRCLDADATSTYITVLRATGRQAVDALLESEGAADYRRSLPEGVYRTLVTECYEVVEELTPSS